MVTAGLPCPQATRRPAHDPVKRASDPSDSSEVTRQIAVTSTTCVLAAYKSTGDSGVHACRGERLRDAEKLGAACTPRLSFWLHGGETPRTTFELSALHRARIPYPDGIPIDQRNDYQSSRVGTNRRNMLDTQRFWLNPRVEAPVM